MSHTWYSTTVSKDLSGSGAFVSVIADTATSAVTMSNVGSFQPDHVALPFPSARSAWRVVERVPPWPPPSGGEPDGSGTKATRWLRGAAAAGVAGNMTGRADAPSVTTRTRESRRVKRRTYLAYLRLVVDGHTPLVTRTT